VNILPRTDVAEMDRLEAYKATARLTDSLIEFLRKSDWITVREVQVQGMESGRVDVAAIRPSQFVNKELRGYEVKVSHADFMADVRESKFRKYLGVFHRVYFAAPSGLLRKGEIPPDAGLITYQADKGWQVVKHAPLNKPANLDVDAMLSLIFAMKREDSSIRSLRDRVNTEENIPLKEKAKNIGYEVAAKLAGKRGEIEPWAYDILQLCEQLTGQKLADPLDRGEFKEELRAALAMKRYMRILYDFSDFIHEFKYHYSYPDDRLKKAVSTLKRELKAEEDLSSKEAKSDALH
jgi:hypothetical protein